MTSSSFPGPDRADLRADCGSCAALCCAAFGFTRSADFPVDKAPGDPCRNLADDFSCTVHESLRPRGYRGCTVFDCAGAGQRVTGQLYGGVDRHQRQDVRVEMFAVFRVVRQLHDLLWYLAEGAVRRLQPEASAALVERIEDAIGQGPTVVLGLDLVGLHEEVRAVLVEVSAEVRGGYATVLPAVLSPGADLMGRRFHGVSLCGADLRGAYLIGADLSGADLDGVDLLGADLRGARVHGADLSGSLFLTQMQVNAAQGDERTRLPVDVVRPSHWGSGGA
ncbi:pentapeptide repeat-containing protein [Curtobacterium sp. ODYSSEY 48 V2]|uniref:pentapeptide repeat-containing protein n=1 Tax=unclassified Curtobacterium TaxID=257496 RepID=UPI001AE878A4|nr:MULTISPECIES: pentapeptide repeat-containing protein [unclassified Curtobacterium]MBP1302655.1 hypothetical protein [Curtobacterium sp. 1310]MCM3506558.1 pentapeptide repeat-containing protein [Curtobacterium sp. ODYSSEY 48 V2]